MTKRTLSVPERFWAKVDTSGDCWEWTAGKFQAGYGAIKISGKQKLAHRVAYEMSVGPIPPGLDLDHRCRNRGCVNPDHLRPVTRKQNIEHAAPCAQSNNKSSGVRGVSWNIRDKVWQTHVRHHGKVFCAGTFSTIEAAEAAVTAKRNELFTHNDADRIRA